ncbi:hypothetical protein RHGRI_000170 [Rhododendron griersonianum]|uniref:Uncharacterized protein n=1 Tax=Rhododendron griersonianum TaxID=479676 RepID=A0AAV6LIJ8_9ERIC|nr:hypothetical protein RHGRI_000170 [Rhododendron griersonianum]
MVSGPPRCNKSNGAHMAHKRLLFLRSPRTSDSLPRATVATQSAIKPGDAVIKRADMIVLGSNATGREKPKLTLDAVVRKDESESNGFE